MKPRKLHIKSFTLESGVALNDVDIAYHTYGTLNRDGSNVVWVCHALTASSDAASWWDGLIGPGTFLDPDRYFIVCANILGSVYGTTGPRSINTATGATYGLDFPFITVRDVTNLHVHLAHHLKIARIHLLIGGSFGGSQALEMAIDEQWSIDHLFLIATGARESPWNIAIHESQRMALKADQTFTSNTAHAGEAGLAAARAIGILSYRTAAAFDQTQQDSDDRLDQFRASSYMQYQGQKLVKRFHAHSYWHLINCLDTHNVGRSRDGVEQALQKITAKTLVVGIDSDRLLPTREQQYIAEHIPDAGYREITSTYGHDGFLIETAKITRILADAFATKSTMQ